ncbi:MAG: 4-hydroxythreonine-4-phosphate dehydrogenase PdxA [Planctomycetota bacterium]|jgi:4-hydroxythreonine-4-phosphate dehydrogenase
MPTLPHLAVTCGDPAGIGPELCCHLAADSNLQQRATVSVIGSRRVLERVAERCHLTLPAHIIDVCPAPTDPDHIHPGQGSAGGGHLALAAISHAVHGCLSGTYTALVTAPISKAAINAAGCHHPGHTELIADLCACDPSADPVMLLHDPQLAVALVTIHQSLASVASSISRDKIVHVGCQLDATLNRLLGRRPRLAVLGLNPHAGEGGLFGDEEARIIAPAINDLRAAGCDVSDPLPPDTAFTARARSRYDGFVAMYHDQGLAPFKALAFADGVNVTLGLPIVRTSPDHGTAYDLAWQGRADPASMLAAAMLACDLSVN